MKKRKQKDQYKIVVELDSSVIKLVDEISNQFKKAGIRTSRTSIIRDIVNVSFHNKYDHDEQMLVYDRLVQMSAILKSRAIECKNDGASSHYLMAAVREIEALSVVDDKNEELIRTTLITVIQLLKKATGYRNLPDVPVGASPTHMVS